MLLAKRSPFELAYVLDDQARLIVADDDPILREFAKVHLAGPAVTIDTAGDGIEAWERLIETTFDMALIDLDMPRLDGLGLIMRIRSDERMAALPVVVITGRDDLFAIDRAYEVGATSYVTKPLNWRLLSYQLRFVLRADRAARAAAAAARATATAELADTPAAITDTAA